MSLTNRGTSGNVVEGNYIGTDAAGTGRPRQRGDGVGSSSGASDNTIGGTAAAAPATSSAATPATASASRQRHHRQRGRRATTSAPTPPAPPPWATAATASTIDRRRPQHRSAARRPAARNVISGNTGDGVDHRHAARPATWSGQLHRHRRHRHRRPAATPTRRAYRSTAPATPSAAPRPGPATSSPATTTRGVRISTARRQPGRRATTSAPNAAGTAALANVDRRLHPRGATATRSAAPPPAARNVISGNTTTASYLDQRRRHGNLVAGNYIGTNAAGTAAVGQSATPSRRRYVDDRAHEQHHRRHRGQRPATCIQGADVAAGNYRPRTRRSALGNLWHPGDRNRRRVGTNADGIAAVDEHDRGDERQHGSTGWSCGTPPPRRRGDRRQLHRQRIRPARWPARTRATA